MAKIAVVFWSGTGNTEVMANCILDGLKAGGADAELFNVSDFSADKLDSYDKIAFGCPAMGSEELESDEFEPFFASIEGKLAGKKIALFGSYEWAGEGAGGAWMDSWIERCDKAGASVFEGKGEIAYDNPSEEAQESCKEFGKRFAQ
ncbi:flavodoxin [Treponema phagedenis]|uniref:flavodoxin n=1 Tax=Treponema phagedenis TaxID=162 RepID=UPI0001F63C7C|nr:flavodoxin [Treponema phagedenis]EFW37934.1 flavodoxin [Treponema phagedenis F0421]TYT76484.1 flavodoxin [Treponema phagedenis]TYT76904.1 flavodoxin [Treponema phagedenis]TYT79797.1 flavodoxin [Treponema phagedenis]